MLAQRYDVALAALDRAAELDPPRPYIYAIRGYILRQLRQPYDASLAESKAARLSGSHDLSKLFPPINPVVPEVFATPMAPGRAAPPPPPQPAARPWNQRSAAERVAVQARFATRNIPVMTFALMIINIGVYLVCLSLSGFNLFNTANFSNPVYNYGIEIGLPYLQQDPTQWYRIFTAMFLHLNIYHIGVNMLSLYFVGVVTEQIFGHWRFLTIYLASGIIAGVAQVVLPGNTGNRAGRVGRDLRHLRRVRGVLPAQPAHAGASGERHVGAVGVLAPDQHHVHLWDAWHRHRGPHRRAAGWHGAGGSALAKSRAALTSVGRSAGIPSEGWRQRA